MELTDQERIQVGAHANRFCATELTAVSNNDGVYAYFVSDKTAHAYGHVVAVTLKRLEILMDKIEIDIHDETSYSELELIFSELKKLDQLEIL